MLYCAKDKKCLVQNHDLGKWGEQLALRFLEDKGYKLLAANWRYGRDELDLVMLEGDTLVFVEVKTRRSQRFGPPEAAVGQAKVAALCRAAQAFVDSYAWQGALRFDVVAVQWKAPAGYEIVHIKDAIG